MPTIRPTRCIRITIPDPLRYWRCRRCPGHVWNARRFPGGAAAAPAVLATLADDTEIPPTRQPRAPYISISGTTSGGSGPVRVMWHTSTGLSGTASGSANWSASAVPLTIGGNQITVTATDGGGRHGVAADLGHAAATARTASARIPPATPAPTPAPPTPTTPSFPAPPGSPGDTPPPRLVITYPGSSIMATTANAISLQGIAADNIGVASITEKFSRRLRR